MPRYFALVPAAGLGARVGADIPKQYLEIAGRPVLWHALRTLCTAPRIEQTWVVLSPSDQWFDRMDWSAFDGRLSTARCGGDSRAASVLNGLRAMEGVGPADWVLVHDAARPCLTYALVEHLISQVGDDPAGGILAVPVSDTLKRADVQGRITMTEPRAGLWGAQTPQMFRHGALAAALGSASLEHVTDEASAMEARGVRPQLVPGSTSNIKITYPQDLAIARLLLEAERKT
jgi:2-C-methyl-D-erythritol 4-phosphate cytidylyltransferase